MPDARGCRATGGGLEGSSGELLEAAQDPKTSSGELFLETSWRLTPPSWRLLESLGDILGALGAVLEMSREGLGQSWRRIRGLLEAPPGGLGAVLGALEAMLEPSGGQKAPKMEPKRVPNRAPEATRAKNDETLIFDKCLQKILDF